MHYHCEIVIPPTPKSEIKSVIAKVLAPFNEGSDPDDEDVDKRTAFWDFWVIGGRWAGAKLTTGIDQDRLAEFEAWLTSEKCTVAGLQAGKQRLQPTSQEERVDAKWNEMFPSDKTVRCPLFAHSNDQYNSDDTIDGDIARFGNVPATLSCSRVIFVGPNHRGELSPVFMLQDEFWNGVTHVDAAWDGSFGAALSAFKKHCSCYTDAYRASVTPNDDWLVVTVDYHS